MLKKCLLIATVTLVSGCSNSVFPLTQKECGAYYSVLNAQRTMSNGTVLMDMTYDCKERIIRASYRNSNPTNDTTFVNDFVNKWTESTVCPLLNNPRITHEVLVTGIDSNNQKVLHKRFNRSDCN